MTAAGFGTSFALTGSTTTVMAAAPPGYAGTVSALFNTARQVGSAAGVALGGSLLASAADLTTGVRTSMAVGAAAYLLAATLAYLCIPRPKSGPTDGRGRGPRTGPKPGPTTDPETDPGSGPARSPPQARPGSRPTRRPPRRPADRPADPPTEPPAAAPATAPSRHQTAPAAGASVTRRPAPP
ncbi:hypothetical protein AB0D08_10100 [Kitasatospora sp. NPDC048540]|uniref:hypothetical protein n=1 Tax=Kitasatospora sp. NPDC048540 TaxID=3155634 RepID=UPI00340103C5